MLPDPPNYLLSLLPTHVPNCPPSNRQSGRHQRYRNWTDPLLEHCYKASHEYDDTGEVLDNHRGVGYQAVKVVGVHVDVALELREEGGVYPIVWIVLFYP